MPFTPTGNNPLNYIDPSGHAQVCAQGDYGGECGSDGTNEFARDRWEPDYVFSRYMEYLKEDFLRDHIPSGVVILDGVSTQDGFIIENGEATESLVAFMFSSGEFAYLESQGEYDYMGTPSIGGGQFYGGIQLIYGATELKSILGKSTYEGSTFSADAFGKVIATEINGRSVNANGTPYIDPNSGRPVTFGETTIGFGYNVLPNVVDIGKITGTSDTRRSEWSGYYYKIPWWPSKVKWE